MRKQYDFSDAKPNSYAKKLKTQITIRLENDTQDYFKQIATETDLPYQTLINLFLRDCAESHKRPDVKWTRAKGHA